MITDLLVIVFGIALALGFMVLVAYLLQRWLVDHRHTKQKPLLAPAEPNPLCLEMSRKLQSQPEQMLPNYDVEKILPIPENTDLIVLLSHKISFRNILRCHPNGKIVWLAELPTDSNDVYTHIDWNGNSLTANSWSCFYVTLDINTGKILSSAFTK